MDKKIRITLCVADELLCDIDALASELSLSRDDTVQLLLERSLYEKKLSDIEKNMIKGYAVMGTINTEMANEAITSDNEAVKASEEYLAGV